MFRIGEGPPTVVSQEDVNVCKRMKRGAGC